MHREFPPISFIAATLLLLPLPWHWRAGNIATLSIIFWLFVVNIINGVDAIIWGDNVDIVVPVWCDITGKFIVGLNFALPAACLCICVHLEQVASVRHAGTSFADKRRRQIYEAIMCFGQPLLFMGLHYIVQGHRFDIIEEYGCRPTTYISIPAIFIIWIPPLIMSVATMIFSCLALKHFIYRRISFSALLDASQSSLTTSRYFRLMVMAVVQMISSLLVCCFTIAFSLSYTPLRLWKNWAFVHSDFSRIDQYQTVLIPPPFLTTYYLLWWSVPASSFLFVAFFSFGKDAVDEYKACFAWFTKNVLRINVDAKSEGRFRPLSIARFNRSGATSLSNRPQVSTNTTSFPSPSLPDHKYLSPTATPDHVRSRFDDFEYDSGSSISRTSFSYVDSKITEDTPSAPPVPEASPNIVATVPLSPPKNVTTLHLSHARPCLLPVPRPSLRPFTYPSFDVTHREILRHHV